MLACHYNSPMFSLPATLIPARMPPTQIVLCKPDTQRIVKPKYQVSATHAETLLQVELPGVAKEDVAVEYDDTRLTVTAKRQVVTRIKRVHGANEQDHDPTPVIRYKLQLSFTDRANLSDVSNASYKDGVLNIRINTVAKHPSRRIEIL